MDWWDAALLQFCVSSPAPFTIAYWTICSAFFPAPYHLTQKRTLHAFNRALFQKQLVQRSIRSCPPCRASPRARWEQLRREVPVVKEQLPHQTRWWWTRSRCTRGRRRRRPPLLGPCRPRTRASRPWWKIMSMCQWIHHMTKFKLQIIPDAYLLASDLQPGHPLPEALASDLPPYHFIFMKFNVITKISISPERRSRWNSCLSHMPDFLQACK